MDKNTCVIYAPFETYSGYGARSRDVAKAIIELKQQEWDIKLLPCRWGNTSMNFIDDNPEWEGLKQYFIPQLDFQPDIMIWITVPNEFQKVGKFNIGITAGIESTIAPAEWVEGCSRMDLILGSSKHTIETLKNSKFEKRDKNTNQVIGQISWEGDSEVLFEGARTDIYTPLTFLPKIDLSNIKENFCYLFVGHWLPGQVGEDRKNVGLLIKAFYETFKNTTNPPALILKTSKSTSSYMDRDEIIKHIKAIKSTVKSKKLPKIYLLHGDFTDEQMNEIYNHSKVKAMVNLTKGEGFGRPLLEFSMINKPIITTYWSGHIDYLDPEFTTLLPGILTNIHPSAANHMLLKEAQWLSVDYGTVGFYLKDVYKNYKEYKNKANRQGYKSRTEYSFDAMKNKLNNILSTRVPILPKLVELNLPKLTKIK